MTVSIERDALTWMRYLYLSGVTHFVVTDAFYEWLAAKVEDIESFREIKSLEDLDYPKSLHFRGNRVLRQADLEHLPFDATPGKPKKPTWPTAPGYWWWYHTSTLNGQPFNGRELVQACHGVRDYVVVRFGQSREYNPWDSSLKDYGKSTFERATELDGKC